VKGRGGKERDEIYSVFSTSIVMTARPPNFVSDRNPCKCYIILDYHAATRQRK
jgi:hypothetical protein